MGLGAGPAGIATAVGLATTAGLAAWAAQPWLRSQAGLPTLARRAAAPAGASALAAAAAWAAVESLRPGLLALVLLAVITPALVEADLTQRRLPVALTRPAVAISALVVGADVAVTGAGQRAVHAVLVGLTAWMAFAALRALSRGGMGRGDITLAGLLGVQLGWLAPATAALGLFLGFTLVAVVLAPAIALGAVSRRMKVPFGPFLLLGAWSSVAAVVAHRLGDVIAPVPSWAPQIVLAVVAVAAAGWALHAGRPVAARPVAVPPSAAAHAAPVPSLKSTRTGECS